MNNVVIIEDFQNAKKSEYINFAEQLGADIRFSNDKWVCEKLRRAPADDAGTFTIYFSGIPKQHREMVKYFSVIRLIQGCAIKTVKTNITGLVRFFAFWSSGNHAGLHVCDDFIATQFYHYLKGRETAEITNASTWANVRVFFKTMNGWDNTPLKNPFSVSPYYWPKNYEDKYIPENVALQLDDTFRGDAIALHLRCAYWLLRLIPSRISEIVGMRIDCLKRYDGHYVLFIPTWKQNGGWREPIIRSIHLEETGIAGYLIDLIKQQQDAARELQIYLPDDKKSALFTYCHHCKRYAVSTKNSIRIAFRKVCVNHSITDNDGKVYEVTTHQFRHNGITDRLAAGFTAAQIAEMTGHHGSAMIHNAYAHLNLLPETIIKKQECVSEEDGSRNDRYVLFGGRILNMEEQLEKRLLGKIRAHRVRGGICGDITGCKSDMWNCLECGFFVPDADQLDYYKEQALLWREKGERFSTFPIIKGNAERNAELFERVISQLQESVYLP